MDPFLDLFDFDIIYDESVFSEVEPRVYLKNTPVNQPILSKKDAVNYIKDKIIDSPYEQTFAIYLDGKSNPLGFNQIGLGSLDKCPLSFRKILQTLLLLNASNIMIIHNHPSCNEAKLSKGDIKCIKTLNRCLALIGDAFVCDSIVYSQNTEGNHYYSLLEDTTLNEEDNPLTYGKLLRDHIRKKQSK